MDEQTLCIEADACRQKALSYLGKPEAPFLLSVAREFDRLATELTIDGLNDRDTRPRQFGVKAICGDPRTLRGFLQRRESGSSTAVPYSTLPVTLASVRFPPIGDIRNRWKQLHP